jgi:hypothetical protein
MSDQPLVERFACGADRLADLLAARLADLRERFLAGLGSIVV